MTLEDDTEVKILKTKMNFLEKKIDYLLKEIHNAEDEMTAINLKIKQIHECLIENKTSN